MVNAKPGNPVQKGLFAFQGMAGQFHIFESTGETVCSKQNTTNNIADNINSEMLFTRQETWEKRKLLFAFFTFDHTNRKYLLLAAMHNGLSGKWSKTDKRVPILTITAIFMGINMTEPVHIFNDQLPEFLLVFDKLALVQKNITIYNN
jgi:hypothetical protein